MGNLMGGAFSDDISDEDFNLIFDMFDTDKSGTVEKEEMVDFIKHFIGGEKQDSQVNSKVVTSKPSVRGSMRSLKSLDS